MPQNKQLTVFPQFPRSIDSIPGGIPRISRAPTGNLHRPDGEASVAATSGW
ncbi:MULTISPECIES: hypothetical protein [Kribbella]|uniref:hypothetical protein n=1 Tax=Kribbella TaxID=182639 RepID=UPI0013053084|nr:MULTISPECIES: hypothetical protein [Kribbella]